MFCNFLGVDSCVKSYDKPIGTPNVLNSSKWEGEQPEDAIKVALIEISSLMLVSWLEGKKKL